MAQPGEEWEHVGDVTPGKATSRLTGAAPAGDLGHGETMVAPIVKTKKPSTYSYCTILSLR